MNLDLLKKLTRLANNNPNENEANLAARRVCKLLEEGNWALPTVIPKTPPIKPDPPFTTPDFHKMWKEAEAAQKMNEEDTRRQRERNRQYREGSWEPPEPDPFWKVWEQADKAREKARKQTQTGRPEPGFGDDTVSPFSDPDWFGNPSYDFINKNRARKQSQREKDAERAEWIFSPMDKWYFNVRTGDKMTEEEFVKRFGFR